MLLLRCRETTMRRVDLRRGECLFWIPKKGTSCFPARLEGSRGKRLCSCLIVTNHESALLQRYSVWSLGQAASAIRRRWPGLIGQTGRRFLTAWAVQDCKHKGI